MNLESQVINLELAKRLKGLNVKQESLFWWNEYSNNIPPMLDSFPRPNVIENNIMTYYSAFTISELSDKLPYEINDRYLLIEKCFSNLWQISYIAEHYTRRGVLYSVRDQNLANACANMIIYLLENGLIKNEINPQD